MNVQPNVASKPVTIFFDVTFKQTQLLQFSIVLLLPSNSSLNEAMPSQYGYTKYQKQIVVGEGPKFIQLKRNFEEKLSYGKCTKFIFEQERKYNKKISMIPQVGCKRSDILQYLASFVGALSPNENLNSFLLAIQKTIKQLTGKCLGQENKKQYLLEFQKIISSVSRQSLKTSGAGSSSLIFSKHKQTYFLAAELIMKVHLASLLIHQPAVWLNQGKKKELKDQMAKLLQRLRFQLQIQNINTLQDKSATEFQYYIESIVQFVGQFYGENQVWEVLHEAMGQDNSNIHQKTMEKIISIMVGITKRKIKALEQMPESKNANQNYVMRYICLKQQQFVQKNKQNLKRQREPKVTERKTDTWQGAELKKSKQIIKSRTIYQSRKNMYTPRRKLQELQKCDSLDQSTQWSLTQMKMRKSIRDINQDFQEDVLVLKTPKPSKMHFSKPIQIQLNFL